ncbi:antirestriction protein ArdA [Streptomyces spectabilis]|uniref:antirestriction protein ArdA n=1 Tax=Streptomyces spectabilis TaxID=68270 RepID=UPI0033CA8FF1
MSRSSTPHIYVASLADYNAGHLHGRWIDADQSADEILAEIGAMLAASPIAGAEDYAIHDSEGFGGIRLAESLDLEDVVKLAELVTEHPPELVEHFDGEGYAPIEIAEQIAEHLRGIYESLADYADEWIGDSLPAHLREYRWSLAQAIASDWEDSGNYLTIRTHDGVAVLTND